MMGNYANDRHEENAWPRFARLWLGYFLATLATGIIFGWYWNVYTGARLAPNLYAYDGAYVSLGMTNQQVQSYFGGGDQGSYAGGAHALLSGSTFWRSHYVALWPPGMFVLQAALLSFSERIPIPLALLVLTSAVWALVFAQIAHYAARHGLLWAALLLPMPFLALSIFRDYFLGQGVLMTESLSTAFLVLALGSLLEEPRDGPLRTGAVAGTLIAVSAYIRVQSYLMMTPITVLTGAVWIAICAYSAYKLRSWLSAALGLTALVALWLVEFAWVTDFRHGVPILLIGGAILGFWQRATLDAWLKSSTPLLSKQVLRVCLLLLATVCTYQALTLPYRWVHDMEWVNHDGGFNGIWHLPQELGPVASFLTAGGILTGCEVDPETCEDIRLHRLQAKPYDPATVKALTFHSFRLHWGSWIWEKLPYLGAFWFGNTGKNTLSGAQFETVIVLENVLISFALLLGMWLILKNPDPARWVILLLFGSATATVLAACIVVFFEGRYLFTSKTVALYLLMIGFVTSVERSGRSAK